MKNFITNKKVIITFISCLVVILLVVIGITAMRMVAKNSSIGAEAAKKFAYIDAGVEEENVKHIVTEFTYKDSTYVYDVMFDTNKKEYYYVVKASNGIILEKKILKKKTHSKKKDKKHKKKHKKKNKTKKKNGTKYKIKSKKIKETTKKVETKNQEEDVDDVIGIDKAKSIAVSDAGESSGNVVFTVARLDGTTYELQFYNEDIEYNYSIDALDGSVISANSINRGSGDSDSE